MLEAKYRLVGVEEVPIRHPVRVFNDFYLSKRGPDGYLDRASFDPAGIVYLLPWMQMLEEIEPEVFRHRVVGTAIVRLLGRDNTGKLFGDGISAELKQTRLKEFRMAFATGEPVLSCSALMQEERKFIPVFRGVFPGRAGQTRLIFLPVASIDERMNL